MCVCVCVYLNSISKNPQYVFVRGCNTFNFDTALLTETLRHLYEMPTDKATNVTFKINLK